MPEDNSEWILWAGLAGAVLLIASPIGGVLNSLSNAVTTPSATSNIQNLPSANNPYNQGFGLANSSNMPNVQALVTMFNQQAQSGSLQDRPGVFTGTGNLTGDGDMLYNAYGFITTDSTAITTALFDLTSQYSISLLNMYITFKYQVDLYSLLTNGLHWWDPSQLLPNSILPDVNSWSSRIGTLPIFPPSFPMN